MECPERITDKAVGFTRIYTTTTDNRMAYSISPERSWLINFEYEVTEACSVQIAFRLNAEDGTTVFTALRAIPSRSYSKNDCRESIAPVLPYRAISLHQESFRSWRPRTCQRAKAATSWKNLSSLKSPWLVRSSKTTGAGAGSAHALTGTQKYTSQSNF